MATRPKVHRSELERAVARIAKRRAKVDDPDREKLPDASDSDPREVLDYLRKFSGPGIPGWVLQADVCDALTLNNWLWWEDRRRELHFLRAGRDRGLFLSQLGAQVGVGKQGVLDRIDRLEALLRYDRPDEKIIRCARRSDREARGRRPVEDSWLHAHRDELVAVIAGLVGQADRYGIDGEDREWLDQLAIDARDDDLTPATMVILGLAGAELRTAPAVLALDTTRPCAVHTLLARADRLRSRFAELGTKNGHGEDRAGESAHRTGLREWHDGPSGAAPTSPSAPAGSCRGFERHPVGPPPVARGGGPEMTSSSPPSIRPGSQR